MVSFLRIHRRLLNNMTKKAEDLNELSLKQLECPICFEYCTPPIVQCNNGHNVCSRCRPRIVDCPICKARMTDVRNLFAEQISSRLKYPCKFAGNGCGEKIVLKEMDDHLAVCSFVIRCQLKVKSAKNPRFYVPCLWLGSHYELGNHVKELHPSKCLVQEYKMIHSFELRMRTDVKLLHAHHEYFWSYLAYDFKTCTMRGMVFCIGSKEKASRFEYQYELISANGQNCVVSRGKVVSSHECNSMLGEYFNDKDKPIRDLGVLVQGDKMVARFVYSNDGVKVKEFRCRVVISLATKPLNSAMWKELEAGQQMT